MKPKRLRMGIDPGYMTGIAIVDCTSQCILHICTVHWDKAVETMLALAKQYGPLEVTIEMPTEGTWGTGGAARARLVGMCTEKARQLQAAAEGSSYFTSVKVRRPVKGATKRGMTDKMWCSAFKWQGRVPSNHARDAAMLALHG